MGSGHSVPPGEMPSDATQLFIILWELAAFIITASYFIVRPHSRLHYASYYTLIASANPSHP